MIHYFGTTDIGRRRPLNEDAIHVEDGLFILCDGMGGHKAGEVASRIAIDSIAAFARRSGDDPEITWPYGFDPRTSFSGNRLRTAIKLANRAVFRKAASADDYTGMGTTVTAALIPSGTSQMTYANVGDSRLYVIRGGSITEVTPDDSWASLGLGDIADAPNLRNVLTKALGAQEEVEFDVPNVGLLDGDIALLSSDGLTNMLSDEQIRDAVIGCGADLEEAGRLLVEQANRRGGHDNISVILVQYRD